MIKHTLCAQYTIVRSIMVLELVQQGSRCIRIVTLHDFLTWFLLVFTGAPSDFEVNFVLFAFR